MWRVAAISADRPLVFTTKPSLPAAMLDVRAVSSSRTVSTRTAGECDSALSACCCIAVQATRLEVKDHQIRSQCGGLAYGFSTIAGFPHDVEIRFFV
jgi:hypothetical protein